MDLYLVRHGEAEHNVDRFVMAETHDSRHSLTDKGFRQAEKTGEYLQGLLKGRAVIYCSPYLRTMQTAEAIRRRLPMTDFYQNPLIREWELGNLYDINNRTPADKKEYKAAGMFYFRYKNGESLADVYLRATLFMNTAVERARLADKHDQLVVVTHAAFIHMLLSSLMNWPVEDMLDFAPIENAAVIKITESAGEYRHEKIFVPDVGE